MKTIELLHTFAETESDPDLRSIWVALAERQNSPPQASPYLLGLCLASLSGMIVGGSIASAIMYVVMR
jgi:hypothetical protein